MLLRYLNLLGPHRNGFISSNVGRPVKGETIIWTAFGGGGQGDGGCDSNIHIHI